MELVHNTVSIKSKTGYNGIITKHTPHENTSSNHMPTYRLR